MLESNSFDESISPFDFNFDDYKIVSNDSGNDFLYITLLFCVATQILLPFLASWGRKLDKLQKLQDLEEGCGDHVDETGAYDVNYNKAPINNRSETEKKIDTDRKDMSPNPIDSRISFDANAKYENNVPVEVKARTSIGDPSLSFESEGGKLLSPVSAITLDVPVLASKERKDLTEDFASKDILTATNKFHTKHDRIKENQHLSQNLRHHSANMPNIHTVQNERMHSNSALLPKTQMKTVKPRDDLPFDEPNDRDIAKDSLNIQDLNTIRGEQVYYVKDQKDIMMNIDPKQAAIIFGIDAGDQEDIVKDVDNYYQCNIEKKRENVTNEDAEDVIENSKRENKSKNEGDYDQYRIEKKDERIRNNDAEDSICDNMSMDDTYTDSFNNPMQNKLKALVNSIATPPVNRGRSTIARNIIDTVPAPELPDHKLRAKFAQQPDPRIPGNSHATFEGNQFMPIPAYRSRSKGVKITDVGIGGRRRQNSLTRRARVTKQIEQYDREDTSTSRTNDLLHNTRQTGDQITSSDSLYSRSHVNGSEIASAVSFQPSRMSRLSESALLPQDAVDAMDEGVERTLARQLEEIRKEDEALHLNYIEDSDICCGDKACWKPATIYKAWDYLLQIANCDDETILILKISVPFTVCEMTETISESLILVLLNYNVGTGAVAAYAVVQMMMRISFEFLRGIVDAQRTLCADAFAQAMGAKQQNLYHNPYLAGQYAQLCTLLYVVTLIPCSYVWFFYMENILTMLGIEEHVAQIGQQFARIAVCRDMIKGTNSGVEALLEVVNREEFCMGMRLLRCLVILITVAVVLILYDIDHSNTDSLKYVAYIQVTVHFIFFMLNIAVSFCKGWMVLFSAGLCRSIALLVRVKSSYVFLTFYLLFELSEGELHIENMNILNTDLDLPLLQSFPYE